MPTPIEMKKALLAVIDDIKAMHSFATDFAPGTLAVSGDDKVYADYNAATGKIVIRTEVKGTGETERIARIEYLYEGAKIKIRREPTNRYNSNNLLVTNAGGAELGNIGADVGDVLSPLIDAGLASVDSASVSYVEPLSKRSSRAKKALLYVEMNITLKKIEAEVKGGSIVCLLGGDQIRTWAQKLTVFRCTIPFEEAMLLFELHNRYHSEYDMIEKDDCRYDYLGLDNLEAEVRMARRKMKESMKSGFSYGADNGDAEDFGEYIKKMARREVSRYGGLGKYADSAEYGESTLDEIIRAHSADSESYFWLDQTRVTETEYDSETMAGFNHYYEIMELYSADDALPFDYEDEDFVSIFGYGKFRAFADLSYGC